MVASVDSVLGSPVLHSAPLPSNTPLNRHTFGLCNRIADEESSLCSPACSYRGSEGSMSSSSSFCEAPSPPSSFGESLGSPSGNAGITEDLTVLDISVEDSLLYETLASDADLEQPAASPRPSGFSERPFPAKVDDGTLFAPARSAEPASPAFHAAVVIEDPLDLVLGDEPLLDRKLPLESTIFRTESAHDEFTSDDLFGRAAKRPRTEHAESVEMTFLECEMDTGTVKGEPSECGGESICGSPEADSMFLETSDCDTQEQLQALSSEISMMDDSARRLIAQALYRLSAAAAPDQNDPVASLEPLFPRSVAVAVAAAASNASGLLVTGSGRKRRVAAATPVEQRAMDAVAEAHRRSDRAVARITFLVDFDPESFAVDASPAPAPTSAPAPPAPSASMACPGPAKPPVPGQPTPPRKRVFFTEDQVRKLNTYYENLAGNKCTPMEIASIASDVGLTEHQVRIYFQNKRARTRKPSSSSGGSGCKTPLSSPPARAMQPPVSFLPPSTPASAAQSPAASPIASPLPPRAAPSPACSPQLPPAAAVRTSSTLTIRLPVA
eukprot:tig00020944_g16376.t1